MLELLGSSLPATVGTPVEVNDTIVTGADGIVGLTLRDNTERPVTVTEGTNRIVGREPDVIRAEAWKLLEGDRPGSRIPKFWDGSAAERIVDVLLRDLESARG